MVRLNADQIRAISRIMPNVITKRPFSVFLYGSRTNAEQRGGDIDLVVVSPEGFGPNDQSKVFKILAQLKSDPAIQDRKINLSLVSEAEIAQEPFWRSIQSKELLFSCN